MSVILPSHSDWPTLGNGPKRAAEAEHDDWELLGGGGPEEESEPVVTEEKKVAFDLAATETKTTEDKATKRPNPKILRHCQSSPDLRCFDELHKIKEEDDDDSGDEIHSQSDTFSFSVLSGPASVVSVNSWGTPGLSFRDAILRSKPAAAGTTAAAATAQQQQRRKIKPRFVVVKPTVIKRCTKSTGDLQSLSTLQEDEDCGGGGGGGGGPSEEAVVGESDAMDFYHRKAKGQQGRENGKIIRPDEAKRLQLIMNKKNAQRQAQAGRK